MGVNSGWALKTNPGPDCDLEAAGLAPAFKTMRSAWLLLEPLVLFDGRFASEMMRFHLHHS